MSFASSVYKHCKLDEKVMEFETRERGIEAYQRKDFQAAIDLLSASPPDLWDAQLYLGMSYYMIGRHVEARDQFLKLKDSCPEKDIQSKASAAFIAVNAKIKESQKIQELEDKEEIEW